VEQFDEHLSQVVGVTNVVSNEWARVRARTLSNKRALLEDKVVACITPLTESGAVDFVVLRRFCTNNERERRNPNSTKHQRTVAPAASLIVDLRQNSP